MQNVATPRFYIDLGQYLIVCIINNHAIGLHGVKGSKYENVLNGEEKDFFINAR